MSKKLIGFLVTIVAILIAIIASPETAMFSCPAIGLAGSVYSGVQGAVDHKHNGNGTT
ncbi:MAG: hypothetical protein HOG49_00785 [Candidatus Scalindua sp.]|jgi:hypothetical protein|nr:hypothetical protein [Candidatus Scalindua sp.]